MRALNFLTIQKGWRGASRGTIAMTRASILSCLSLLAAANFALCANGLNAAEPDGLAALREMAKAGDRLDLMIGQTIMVGFSGQSEHDQGVKAVRDHLANRVIGGVVLYPENISSARQLRLLTAYLANANSTLVPLIAVDQEGGRVQRLDRRTGHTHYPSAQKMGRDKTLTPEEARGIYGGMAKELAGAADLGERVARLAAARTREGYMAESWAEGDEYVLAENHCPICSAATECQGFCRAELETFREVLGPGVEVERGEHILGGSRRCVYNITPKSRPRQRGSK